MSKTLTLPLKRQWFDLIKSGVKKEEYRDIKDYWKVRLAYGWLFRKSNIICKEFDTITFRNGYGSKVPTMVVECKGITVGVGNPDWGAPSENVFIIKLGDILSVTN